MKKQESMKRKKMQSRENVPERSQKLDSLDNDFKSLTINIFKDINYIQKVKKIIKMPHQIENIHKDTEIIKRQNQIQIQKLKTIVTEMKNSPEIKIWPGKKKKKEFTNLKTNEFIQAEKQEKKNIKKNELSLRDLWDTIRHTNICIIRVSEGRGERGRKNI